MELHEEIRNITYAEMDDNTDLSSFAFQYEVSLQDRAYRRQTTRPEHAWGAFVDGKLAAKLYIHPLRIFLGTQSVSMGGIGSVATWPEYRRQGLVAKLIRHALKVMKRDGQYVSMLAPFSFGFYRKYGWEYCIERKTYEIETARLRYGSVAPGTMRAVEHPKHSWNSLGPLYRQYAARYAGMLDREEDWWKSRVIGSKKGRVSVYHDETGARQGYIYYHVENRELRVHDIAFLNEEARRGLMQFIANHDSMAVKTVMTVPSDDMLPYLLSEPRFKQEVNAYFMARIVDASGFIAQYRFAAEANRTGQKEERALLLDLVDEHAEWNHGRFVWRIAADGKAEAVRSDEVQGQRPVVRCDIQTLTAMLMNYVRPMQLWENGRLSGDFEAVHMLESAVPRRVPFLMDYF